jgi:hypothetical protein
MIANGDSALIAMRDGALGASAASIMRSQAPADAKREAKDREREKRQSRKQYDQSMRNAHTHSFELMLQTTCRCIPSLIVPMQLLLDAYIAGGARACREHRAGFFFRPQSSLVHREIPPYNVAQRNPC